VLDQRHEESFAFLHILLEDLQRPLFHLDAVMLLPGDERVEIPGYAGVEDIGMPQIRKVLVAIARIETDLIERIATSIQAANCVKRPSIGDVYASFS